MSDSAKKPPLRERLREATSGAILDAAEGVLAHAGPDGGSMNAIAARAGVSVGTLYNHFRDRDELVRALFADRRAAFLAELDESHERAGEAPFALQLETFVATALGWFDRHRDFARLIVDVDSARPRDDGRAHAMRSITERITRIMARGAHEGVLDPDRAVLYPAILSGILKGVLANLLIMTPERGAEKLAGAVATVVDTFLHGAAVRP